MKKHNKKWSKDEQTRLLTAIVSNKPLDIIANIIERTESAIKTKANHLGFGHYHDKEVDKIYFINKINHKKRRTKEELYNTQLVGSIEKVPIPPSKHVENCDNESTVIIANASKVCNEENTITTFNVELSLKVVVVSDSSRVRCLSHDCIVTEGDCHVSL